MKKEKVILRLTPSEQIEVECVSYDDLTWFCSNKYKFNKDILTKTSLSMCDFRLIDKATGITVLANDNKDKLTSCYEDENFKKAYSNYRQSKEYVARIETYQQICSEKAK